jgi:hypothetical protein
LNATPSPKKATGIVDRKLKSLFVDIQQRTRSAPKRQREYVCCGVPKDHPRAQRPAA